MKRHNMFISDELWLQLEKLAAKKKESIGSIIRRAIAALLKKESAK